MTVKTNPFPKLLPGAVLLVLAATAWFIFSQKPAAPEVGFVTLKGETFRTSDLRGKVVLVNFWATSCTTCVREMPRLVETYRKFAPRGLETIAVAMNYDPPNYVIDYTQKNGLPFKVALDTRGEAAAGFGGVRLTPTTFLIDKRGRIVQQYLGEPDFARLHALLDELLKEAA